MRMPDRLAEQIVQFLRLDESGAVADVEGFTARDWSRVLPWLDAGGLALYFLHRLEGRHGGSILPPAILTRLRQNQEDNRQRTKAFIEEMRVIHRRFAASEVEFALLKGYSLVPAYCPAPALRHQCDLDYLISENDVHLAGRVLHALGYSRLGRAPDSYTFARSTGDLPRRDNIYKAQLNYSVELHTTLWDNDEVAKLEQLPHAFECRQPYQVSGLIFPVLALEDQFIHQCMHVLSHVLQFWVRLAWLYEIAVFLQRMRADAAFWRAVQERIEGKAYVAKAVQLVTLLAASIFHVESPKMREGDSRTLRLWVNEYGHQWALHNLPGSKLSLFLFREFMDEKRWQRLQRQRLFPVHRPHSATPVNASRPRRGMRARLAECGYAGQRLAFHIRETWRYLCEKASWQRRLRRIEAPACAPLESVIR